MLQRCATLVFALALSGSAWAGVPAHAGAECCPLARMADCCLKAQTQGATPEVYAARLCCALNCSLPGTTGPSGASANLLPNAPALQDAAVPASLLTARAPLLWPSAQPEHKQHAPPIYLRHLALLI